MSITTRSASAEQKPEKAQSHWDGPQDDLWGCRGSSDTPGRLFSSSLPLVGSASETYESKVGHAMYISLCFSLALGGRALDRLLPCGPDSAASSTARTGVQCQTRRACIMVAHRHPFLCIPGAATLCYTGSRRYCWESSLLRKMTQKMLQCYDSRLEPLFPKAAAWQNEGVY